MHGYLDYSAVALLLLAPAIFGFSAEAARASYILAGVQLTYSLLTAYPLGAVKMIPFVIHAAIEFVTAAVMIILPWMAGFNDDAAARNFFVAAGLGLMAVWALTDYRGNQTGGEAAGVRSANRKVEQVLR
jgi:hypothetical protein